MTEKCGEVIDGRHRPAKARDTQDLRIWLMIGTTLRSQYRPLTSTKPNAYGSVSDSNGEEVLEERGARLWSVGERIVESLS